MKTKLFILLFAIISGSACNKLNDLATFNINAKTSLQVNSATLINTPFQISTPDITTNSTEAFENNHSTPSLVKKVVLEELKLSITNPQNKTFSFLKNVHIYISTNNDDEIELAYLENIPATATSISLNTSDANLQQFIKASRYTLRTSMETRETLTQETTIQVDVKFAVTAGLL